MNTSAKISHIRELLHARFPQAVAADLKSSADVQTGVECLDQMGMQAGRIHEIVCQTRGTGNGLILSALLNSWGQEIRQPVALVDGADAFDPRDVSTETRERLLWLRCRDVEQAVKGADLLLRDGNISRVLMDLGLCPAEAVRRIPAQAWHRLRMLAEKAARYAASSRRFTPCRARSRLMMKQPHGLDALDRPRTQLAAQLRGSIVRRGMDVGNWNQHFTPGAVLAAAG